MKRLAPTRDLTGCATTWRGKPVRSIARVLLGLGLLLLVCVTASCAGTLAVGFEQTPTPDLAPAATVRALQQENERLSVALATALAPPPAPLTQLGRVAYIRGGDLWVAVLPEGPHQRFTLDGHNREPRWSAKGEWIAYRKDRTVLVERERPCEDAIREGQPPCRETVSAPQQQVWLARRSGANHHVINRGFTIERFAWSPTNDLLAYVNESGHLQTIDPATDIGLRLVSAQGSGRVNAIAWSPDGVRIAYEWVTDEQNGPSTGREAGIWVTPATGGQSVRLSQPGEPSIGLAGWRDAEHVLIWQHPDEAAQAQDSVWLYAAALPRPGAPNPAAEVVQREPMVQHADFLAVAPAKQLVAVTIGAGLPTWTNKRVAAGNFLTDPDLAAVSPVWAPNGDRLAFVAMPDQPGLTLGESAVTALMSRHLWTADVGTGVITQLTDDERYRDERPQWSVQGSHILFVRVTHEGQASLWLFPLAGGAPILVVDELTPAPDPIGTSGYIDWAPHFDWWRG